MRGNTFCLATVLVAALVAMVCGGCAMSTEQTIYGIGIKAMKGDKAFSQGPATVPAPAAKCSFYVGKSAASVEIPYSVSGGSGDGTYVVWVYRIGTRWEFNRSFAVPK